MRTKQLLLAAGVLAGSVMRVFAQSAEPNVKPPDARGVYAIWYNTDLSLLDIPYITGGQIVLQWADVEPAQGKYDFSAMDKQLKTMKGLGKMTTVQINGNQKPKWLYDIVPTNPEKLSHQIGDKEGTLMYWHPTFVKAYTNMLKAYSEHLKKSPYLSILAGVRMNFDAFGTEHFMVPPANVALDQWKVPPGVAQGTLWTPKTAEEYETHILDEYVADFDGINVLLRNNLSDENVERYRKQLETGKLMFFHTSSEMEPRGLPAEHNYGLFYKFARTGKTLAYAEPWADAWGNHGTVTDARWTGPSQWTYWRMLCDLNFGVSMIAVYTHDLEVAKMARQTKQGGDVHQYQLDFYKAFKLAAYYAGYHASPQLAPGAWVAFRHSEKNLMTKNPLKEFTGDYNFLMKEVDEAGSAVKNVVNVGNDAQRYGAWAKILSQGKSVKMALSPIFANSLKGNAAVVRVIYFDDKAGSSFQTAFGGQQIKTELTGSNKWKTLEIPVSKAAFTKDANGADISVTAAAGDITLHMVNVERGTGIPNDVMKPKLSGSKLTWTSPKDYDIDHFNIYSGKTLLATIPAFEQQASVKGTGLVIKSVDESGRESAGIAVK